MRIGAWLVSSKQVIRVESKALESTRWQQHVPKLQKNRTQLMFYQLHKMNNQKDKITDDKQKVISISMLIESLFY